MGGDHKCPVCQATFTRPQHVARHMRSHTGDRPYKCQYCGDQFARSDLLSRHINKCHSNEKPPPTAPGSRRKGSASASRATTSKQACDQCVQSSLPCDGCNPCAKCVQRKCRCTFVKFHRQTAPVGPGHNPRLHPANTTSGPGSISQQHLPSSSLHLHPSRLHPYAQGHGHGQDDLLLGPAPTGSGLGGAGGGLGEGLYSDNFTFSPLYPTSSYPPSSSSYASSGSGSSYPASVGSASSISASSSRSDTIPMTSDPDFTDKYRAQVEMMRRTGLGGYASGPGPSAASTHTHEQGHAHAHAHGQERERSNREMMQEIERQFPVFQPGTFGGPRSGYTPTGTGFTPTFPGANAPGGASGYAGEQEGYAHAGGAGAGAGSGYSGAPGAYSGYLDRHSGAGAGAGRRGSVDYSGSEREGYATGSEGGSSVDTGSSVGHGFGGADFGVLHMPSDRHGHQRRPSSASSLGHHSHLPPPLPHHQQHPHQQHQHPHPHQRRTGYPSEGEGGFSETFGLMSLDDPNVLAGLSSDGAPFFSTREGGVGGDSEDPNITPMPHSSNGGGGNGARGHRSNTLPTPARDALEAEWWNMYMKRTPGTGGGVSGDNGMQGGGGGGGGSGRRPRVASLPSSKTPIALPERFMSSVQGNNAAGRMQLAIPPPRGGRGGHGQGQGQQGGVGGTMHGEEDLTSYEAAVKARGAPVALSLRLPREKRREGLGGVTGTGAGNGKGKSASAGTSPQVPSLGYPPSAGMGVGGGVVGQGKVKVEGGDGMGSRPGSAAGVGSSSLANVFGGVPIVPSQSQSQAQAQALPQQRPGSSASSIASGGGPGRPPSQQQHVTFAPMDVTGSASPPFGLGHGHGHGHGHGNVAYRMGTTASSASPSSRASSVDPGSGGSEFGGSGSAPGSGGGSVAGSVSGGGGGGGGGEALRPSFKRLPSQTLGPVSAKRALLSREEGEESGGEVGAQGQGQGLGVSGGELGVGGVSGATGGVAALVERRRRRMSAPGGAGSGAGMEMGPTLAGPAFVGDAHELA